MVAILRRRAVRIVVVGAVTVAAGVILFLGLNNGGDAAKDDASAVFCMSAEHRAQLVEAASNLKLGEAVAGQPDRILVGGRPMSLRDWRAGAETRAQFRKACAALATALKAPVAPASGGGTNPTVTFAIGVLTALLPVAVGSWLTYAAGARKDAAGIRRLQVENLRSAGVRFVQAADAYLRQRTASGPVAPTALDAVQERRLELAAALGQVAAAHPDWTDLPELRRRLAAEMGGDFVGVAGQLSADTARQWAARVAALADEAERVAAAHEAGARRPGPASTTKTQVTSGGGA